MAKFGPFKNAYLEVNSVDLSDHVESMTINQSNATLDEHAMGDNTAKQRAGLMSWSIDVTFFADFAAASVDATLSPLYSGGTNFMIRAKAENAATSATNPIWSGQAFVSSYQPMGGGHGDELMQPTTFSPAGDLIRYTS